MISKVEQEQIILRGLHNQNEWWTTDKVRFSLLETFKRRDFYFYRKKLSDPADDKILAIIGPRQVGKTTTLFQLIEDLIKSGVNPRRILYNTFDYPYPDMLSKNPLHDILTIYSTSILQQPLQNLASGNRVYMFLDEICKLEKWGRLLKGWYDLKYPIKFIITDSSASDILHGSSESLIGRIDPTIMMPIKFLGYLRYHWEKDPVKRSVDINSIGLNMRNLFKMAVSRKKSDSIYQVFLEAYQNLIPYEQDIKIRLQEYLLKDGYPELLNISDLNICAKKLRDYLSLTFQKDLIRMFQIRNPRKLDHLAFLLAHQSTGLINCANTAKTLGTRVETVKDYIQYLQHIFLIDTSEYYTKGSSVRVRKQSKIYFTNIGLRNALLGTLNEHFLEDAMGLGITAETLMFEHCKRLKFNLEPGGSSALSYWKDKRERGNEVDIIIELFGSPVPVEVKYKNEINKSDVRGVKAFLTNYPEAGFGIIITKNSLKLKGNIVYIPLWLFLLLC